MEIVALTIVIFLFIFVLGIYVDVSKSLNFKQSEQKIRDHSISYRTIKKK